VVLATQTPATRVLNGPQPIIRIIGAVRARAKIGLQNLVYNLRRLVILERMATA
jgi:hypothetical protein